MKKIAASGETIYADPSALLKLYLNEPESRAVSAWRARISGPLTVTHHGRMELTNGVGLAAYRGFISPEIYEAAIAALDDDFAAGRYLQADLLWRATLRSAADISRLYTRSLGCRSLDVIHVASAIELGMRTFVTYDTRQRQLARALKLKIVVPA